MQRIIDNYIDSINQKYPQYSECTAHCFELITELLICDYGDFPSEKKSFRYIKTILKEVITYTFTNAGVKNYLMMIFSFFYVPEVKSFFSTAKIDTKQLYIKVDCIKNHITYWQGYEGSPPERHLKHLLKPLD